MKITIDESKPAYDSTTASKQTRVSIIKDDLISRGETVKLLYDVFEKHSVATDRNDPLGGFGSEVFKRIREMPTAYDISKVIEELEEKKQNALDVEESIKEYGVWCDAIEIVKQDGVSGDVCEWTIFDNSLLTDEPQWVYKTTCGKYIREEHTSKAFVYCPYCGKNIKVVE